jgi:hypothetical protein
LLKELPLEDALLNGYSFPVALVMEVTKQGIVLSKMRYLKAVGEAVNQTIRCASIEMYAHMGHFIDPHFNKEQAGPVGIDLLYSFHIEKGIFNETIEEIKRGRARINYNNPQTRDVAKTLMDKIKNHNKIIFKRLSSHEQGLILEPYVSVLMQKLGEGKRTILQNVELSDREGSLRCHSGGDTVIYRPAKSPTMEVDILLICDLRTLPSIMGDLEEFGFKHEGI